MKTAIQIRNETSDHGTFGTFSYPGFKSFVAEPPWRDNQPRISCIPAGEYLVKLRKSPKYGLTFHVTNVEGRSYILKHSGNYAGDTEKGFKTHTLGCVLHGQKLGYLGGQRSVLNSRMKINELLRITNYQPFKLIIKWNHHL